MIITSKDIYKQTYLIKKLALTLLRKQKIKKIFNL